MRQLVLNGPAERPGPRDGRIQGAGPGAGETVIVGHSGWQAECRRAGSLALGAAPEPARQLGPAAGRQPGQPQLELERPTGLHSPFDQRAGQLSSGVQDRHAGGSEKGPGGARG